MPHTLLNACIDMAGYAVMANSRPMARETTTPPALTNRVREWRKRRELTLEQLAELCAMSYSAVARIEQGKRGLTIDVLVRLARALDVEPAQLLVWKRLPATYLDEFLSAAQHLSDDDRQRLLDVAHSFMRTAPPPKAA